MNKLTRITALVLSFVLMFNIAATAAEEIMPGGDEQRHEAWDERNNKLEQQEKEKREKEKERAEKRQAPKLYEGSFEERMEKNKAERNNMLASLDIMPLSEDSTDAAEEITPYELDTKLGFYSLGKSYPESDGSDTPSLLSTTEFDYSGLTRPEYINNIYAPKVLDNSGDVSVSPYNGDVQVNVTDIVLPGKNGLDLKLNHFYQSSHAEVEYGNEENDYMVKPTTYYNERYALGIGWSFGFPSVEIRESEDGLSKEIYYHDGTGNSYRYNKNDEKISGEGVDPPIYNGYQIYSTNLDNYYTDNVIFSAKDRSYRRGDYRSEYSFKTADNTMQYFGESGELLAIVDRFGNEIIFDYENYPGRNLIDFGSAYNFKRVSGYWDIRDKGVIFDASSKSTRSVRSSAIPIDEKYSDYRISFIYEAPDPKKAFKDPFEGTFNVSYTICSGDTILDTILIEEGITPVEIDRMYTFQADIQLQNLHRYDETPDNIKLLIEVVDGKNELQLWNFRASPMRPLISKITDTVGRTLEFTYEGDVYLEYEDNNFPITVKVKDPDGNIYRNIDYYRTLYTYEWDLFNSSEDLLKSHEHRFFMFTGSDNGEQVVTPVYGKGFEGYFRTDGFTYKVGHGYEFYERPMVIEMDFDYYKTFIEFEKTQKRIGSGFTDTWRAISKYNVDMYGNEEGTDEEAKKYNCTSYYYELGRFHDETAFNRWKDNNYVDPEYGEYVVQVTDSDGAIHQYEYTDHILTDGKRIIEYIRLPLLDREVIYENKEAGGDVTDICYEYDEKNFFAINMPNKETVKETIDGVSRTYIRNYEYDEDSCMVYKSTLNLTEAEERKNEFPKAKTQTVEYKKLSNRLFLPETQTYYQSENGDLLTVSTAYDSMGRKTSETNENGETVYYEYDTVFTWLPTRVYYTDPMKVGDEDRSVEILYEYTDDYGFGPNVTKVKYADGEYAETYAYYEPKYGNLIKTVDENGNETEYTYDEFGRTKYIYTPSYASELGEMYLIQCYSYDFKPAKRVITYTAGTSNDKYAEITADNCVEDIEYEYNGFGNPVMKRDRMDNSNERNIYDLSNRIIGYQNTVDFGTDSYTVSYVYDGLDRIVSATDKMGNTQSVDYKSLSKEFSFTPAGSEAKENHYVENYDIYGNLIKTATYPDGLDADAIVQTYTYDLRGNVIEATDGNGKITSYEYDNIGNPVLVVTPDGKRTETKFSKFGTPTEVTLYNGDESYTIAKTYDDRGLETSTEQKGLDVYTRPWYYEYGNDGNVSVVTEPNGNKKRYTYDNSFNVIGLDMGSENRSYAYNHLGLIDKISSTVNGAAAQTVDYNYGYKGELYEKTVNGETISYDYNELYNLAKVTTPGGHVREYTRDGLQRVTAIKADGKEFKYTYNGDGLVKEIIYPTGDIITSYTYDNANQVTSVVTKKGTEVLAGYEYKYDKAGNIKEISGSENVTYTYDDLYRLSSYTKDGITVSYTYDGRGNIITEESSDGNLVTYAYSGDNRLEKKTENGVETTYEYDLNGNLISDSTGSRYSYDENNKLVYAKADGEEVRYTIGLDGLRTSKTTADGTVEYFTDESGLVVSENSDQIIWGNRALAKKIGSSYYYYIYNAHGDVVMMTDESGNVVNSYSYDPWGVVTSETETVDNSIKYAGEYYDEETGLIYLRTRYYDPSIGRFTQEDPARDEWNWYSYCGNNPVMFVDPSGLVVTRWDYDHCTSAEIKQLKQNTEIWEKGTEEERRAAEKSSRKIRLQHMAEDEFLFDDGCVESVFTSIVPFTTSDGAVKINTTMQYKRTYTSNGKYVQLINADVSVSLSDGFKITDMYIISGQNGVGSKKQIEETSAITIHYSFTPDNWGSVNDVPDGGFTIVGTHANITVKRGEGTVYNIKITNQVYTQQIELNGEPYWDGPIDPINIMIEGMQRGVR